MGSGGRGTWHVAVGRCVVRAGRQRRLCAQHGALRLLEPRCACERRLDDRRVAQLDGEAEGGRQAIGARLARVGAVERRKGGRVASKAGEEDLDVGRQASFVAKCMLGDAHAARTLLLEAPAPAPPGAGASAGEEGGLPPLVVACLRVDAAALAALDGSDACEASADGLPPAFCFAVELGDAAVVEAALAGAKGLDGPQRAVLCAQAARAARTHDAAAASGGYVPGAAAASSTPHLGQG